MTSPASDAEQQWLRQSCTPPIFHTDTPPHSGGESLSGHGASKDTVILIPDDSDTEDEGYCEEEDPDSPRSYATTATSITSHFGSMKTKDGQAESDAIISMDTTPEESPAGVDGDSIRTHDLHLDPLPDPESNLQSHCHTNPTSAGDAGFGTSSIGNESQSCLTTSDEQLVTESIPITPTTSESVAMIDAVPDEEPCGESQKPPVTPSRRTCSLAATAHEVTAQTQLHDSGLGLSTEHDDAALETRSSTPSQMLMPESRSDQDQDHGSCSSSDTESGSSEAGSAESLHRARTCSPSREELSRHHSRRTSLRTREMVQDKDGDTDSECSGSDDDGEDGPDVPERGRDEDYCPSLPEVEGDDSGDDPENEGMNRRKRPKLSLSPYALTLDAPSSRRTRSTSTARSSRRRQTSHSRARSQTSTVPSGVGACVSRFEEWPLSNVSLKRITEGNRTTFQLQFEWIPESNQPHAHTSIPPDVIQPPRASLLASRSPGGKWTTEEEEIVRTMRQAGSSWAEIHRALPHRSQGTIQVRYSTKLKRPNSTLQQEVGGL